MGYEDSREDLAQDFQLATRLLSAVSTLPKLSAVNPPYNNMGFAARRIVIKGVSLYLILVCKMHPKLKLGNDIISIPVKP